MKAGEIKNLTRKDDTVPNGTPDRPVAPDLAITEDTEVPLPATERSMLTLPSEMLEALDLIPRSVAVDYRVLPVGGYPPTCGRFKEVCGNVRLLCLLKLSNAQRKALHFLLPGFSFEFIDPDHEDYQQYQEIVVHFEELVEQHYRSKGPQLFGID
ncbi:MAG: hypothetical protein G01um1014106_695 [Parcubacteria group bacterium Gr01-1014_106]|nr:MAG: hypothetical protein G01um1014106_695 [Parcubacteria group bacterium Gr01-1014_106]